MENSFSVMAGSNSLHLKTYILNVHRIKWSWERYRANML